MHTFLREVRTRTDLLKIIALSVYLLLLDTAQSITDGVDFRFDEVRSCFYSLMNYNIFEHPKRLNTNFRSHDGIIQAANSVLQLLYKTFPKSVDEMDTQTGLARGRNLHLCSVLHKNFIGDIFFTTRTEAWYNCQSICIYYSSIG